MKPCQQILVIDSTSVFLARRQHSSDFHVWFFVMDSDIQRRYSKYWHILSDIQSIEIYIVKVVKWRHNGQERRMQATAVDWVTGRPCIKADLSGVNGNSSSRPSPVGFPTHPSCISPVKRGWPNQPCVDFQIGIVHGGIFQVKLKTIVLLQEIYRFLWSDEVIQIHWYDKQCGLAVSISA